MSTERADRLEERFGERGVDAFLVSGFANLRYLSGFVTDNGFCVVGPGIRTIVTDFRYVEQVRGEAPDWDLVQGERDLFASIADVLGERGVQRLGFEDHHISVRSHTRLRGHVPDATELVAAGGLVEELRAVKEPGELDAIRAAATLADEVLAGVPERGLVGRTEREVSNELQAEMRRLGAEGPSFPPIVAAGAHGALPHAVPRDVEIEAGTLVVVDMGCVVDGYCSDCTRTFATGQLDDDAAEAYELVLRAQESALGAVKEGAVCKEVDAVARDAIAAAGHAEHFGHGLGHGVGLEVHEAPTLGRTAEGSLHARNVVTVEPGVYVPGRFGVRIEDLVVVGEGGPEVLTSFPKTLVTAPS
jgi:Xaa-Pro aminopeptidase